MTQLTTRTLIDDYFNIVEEIDFIEEQLSDPDAIESEEQLRNQHSNLQNNLNNIASLLTSKFDNVYKFNLELDRRNNIIQAEIDTLKKEITRLKRVKDVQLRAKEYMHYLLKEIIKTKGTPNKSGNLEIKTDIARFVLEKHWGGLEITDQSAVPSEYIIIEQKINNAKLRRDIIKEKNGVESYAKVQRKEVVRMR